MADRALLDQETRHWVRFVVRRVPTTEQKPHGLDYSLTLHDADGERLVGFDNSHPVRQGSGPGSKTPDGTRSQASAENRAPL